MSLLENERETYAELWSSVGAYAENSPGEQYLPVFLQVVGDWRGTVLDAGTGSGKGALALKRAGFDVRLCDVTDAGLVAEASALPFRQACLWSDFTSRFAPGFEFDWVYCTDVMEHIPPQFTMLAVYQMLKAARNGLFLTVSLVPDSFGVWAGKSLHQTVQSFDWWKQSLNEVGRVVDARDLISNAVFVVEPR
jgi:SAM-dependent methyltransferase